MSTPRKRAPIFTDLCSIKGGSVTILGENILTAIKLEFVQIVPSHWATATSQTTLLHGDVGSVQLRILALHVPWIGACAIVFQLQITHLAADVVKDLCKIGETDPDQTWPLHSNKIINKPELKLLASFSSWSRSTPLRMPELPGLISWCECRSLAPPAACWPFWVCCCCCCCCEYMLFISCPVKTNNNEFIRVREASGGLLCALLIM